MKEKLLKICELLKGVPAMYATGLRTGATSNLIESQSLLDSIIATLDSEELANRVDDIICMALTNPDEQEIITKDIAKAAIEAIKS